MKRWLSCFITLFLLFSLTLPVFAEAAEALTPESLFGFQLVREEEIPDIGATARIYKHEKTEAEVIWLKNDDPFKVFAATFRTEPSDSTGAPHIIEHALLGGSRKYQSNDLFTDMNAISTNAYMNASTYADKTVFPVASRDPQDFANLVDIYLDSVFFPNIKEDKSVFDQEGWHYEIFSKEDPIVYNGVVYNEMRGASSNPMRLLNQDILAALYPDTIYANDSGGNPDCIPALSYEQFLGFYNTYYNPSNAMLYFYGDVDIEKYLEILDAEYFSPFERQEVQVKYEKQKAFAEPRETEAYYNIGSDEDPEGKTYLTWHVTCGDGGNALDYFMLDILSDVLVDANYAPIKNALFDQGIGEDNGSYWLALNTNAFGVVAINAEAEQKDEFVAAIKACLQQAAEEGINPELLESSINKLELYLREAGSSGLKGMDYLDLILDAKNYGGDPLSYLQYDEIFEQLRSGIKDGIYEKFIQERLLDNPHQSTLVLRPQQGLSDEKAAETEKKLAEYKASLSEEALQTLIDENIANEEKKNKRGVESKLPHLKLDEINTNLHQIDYAVKDFDGTPLLFSVLPSSGIIYADLEFDLSVIPVEKIPYAALLANLLGSLDTEHYSYGDLEKEIYMASGGIFTGTRNAEHTKTHELDSRFQIYGKATAEKFPRLLELIDEVCNHTVFEDKEWIGQQITQMKAYGEMGAHSEGLNYALTRVRSYFSPMFKYRDMMSGWDNLRFIQELEARYADDPDAVIAELQDVAKTLFNRKGLVIGIAADEDSYPVLEAAMKPFLEKMPNEDLPNKYFDVTAEQLNEGVLTNNDVNYVVMAGDLKKVLGEVDGSAHLITNILDNYYLYPELRQKGGAYGAYSLLDNYGNLCFYSYRDPNLQKTVEVFKNAGKFLSELEMSDEELEQLIIGYFKAYPITPETVASDIVYREINGISNDDFVKEAEAVVSTDLAKIKSFGAAITQIMEENYLCVFGNAQQVQDQKDLFKTIVSVELETASGDK